MVLPPLSQIDPRRFETVPVFRALVSANRALAELKGLAASIPNQNILINTLTLQEARDSSAIENIVTTQDDLYRDADPGEAVGTATKEVLRYMRDVVDHQTHAADQIASYDEMLSSLVQAALAKVGMQQNTDMRKISAWVAIAAVPTMIAGIYGMNFTHMPELDWSLGYPLALLVMAASLVAMFRAFKRSGWL